MSTHLIRAATPTGGVNMSLKAQGAAQTMRKTGWILSGIVVVFMVADAGATLFAIEPIKKAMLETGFPLDQLWLIGGLQLLCRVLYAIPATSMFGAIILTGLLGGAITSHLRAAGTLTPEMIVSLSLGALAWSGLWFRDARLRVLIPRRRFLATRTSGSSLEELNPEKHNAR